MHFTIIAKIKITTKTNSSSYFLNINNSINGLEILIYYFRQTAFLHFRFDMVIIALNYISLFDRRMLILITKIETIIRHSSEEMERKRKKKKRKIDG